jgi:hypothetical protein
MLRCTGSHAAPARGFGGITGQFWSLLSPLVDKAPCPTVRRFGSSSNLGNTALVDHHDHTSFTSFSGKLRTGLPVAAKIALSTAGATTQMVGSPTPPQKS